MRIFSKQCSGKNLKKNSIKRIPSGDPLPLLARGCDGAVNTLTTTQCYNRT